MFKTLGEWKSLCYQHHFIISLFSISFFFTVCLTLISMAKHIFKDYYPESWNFLCNELLHLIIVGSIKRACHRQCAIWRYKQNLSTNVKSEKKICIITSGKDWHFVCMLKYVWQICWNTAPRIVIWLSMLKVNPDLPNVKVTQT